VPSTARRVTLRAFRLVVESDADGADVSRIDLRVPFSEKDEAKSFGARWDPSRKTWYVPAGVDSAPLQKWLPMPQAPNIRAWRYFLATTTRDCWRCGAATRVVAFVLPAGHEVFKVEDDPAEDFWEMAADPTVLSHVRDLADSVLANLRRKAPHYGVDFSQTTQSFYWMNHCEHCAAKLGDFDTHGTPGVGFMPKTSDEAAGICLEEIAEPFFAWCGSYSCGLEWFADAQRCVSSPQPI
jgi:Domain of unknown function (DUF5710)